MERIQERNALNEESDEHGSIPMEIEEKVNVNNAGKDLSNQLVNENAEKPVPALQKGSTKNEKKSQSSAQKSSSPEKQTKKKSKGNTSEKKEKVETHGNESEINELKTSEKNNSNLKSKPPSK